MSASVFRFHWGKVKMTKGREGEERVAKGTECRISETRQNLEKFEDKRWSGRDGKEKLDTTNTEVPGSFDDN